MFWVGSEAEIRGQRPSIWKRYDESLPFRARVDSVGAWFRLPEPRRPHLVTLYFHEPDATGHAFGVHAPETAAKVAALDSLLGYITETMSALDIYPQLNIIIVSDHGMADISPDRVIRIDQTISMTGVTQERSGPYSFLYGMNPLTTRKVVKQLSGVPHLKAYRKKNIPRRWHYKKNYRIKDVLLVADEGWSILNVKRDYNEKLIEKRYTGATHGYDNRLRSMQAIFLADGPAFKDGYRRETFENIQIYPIIAEILDLKPYSKIDGSVRTVKDLFRN